MVSLTLNVKTHKEQGSVKCRAIHAVSQYPWAPLGRWVSQQIRPELKSLSHILYSTDQFLTELSKVVLSSSDMFFTADVKEFFTMGSPNILAPGAAKFAPLGTQSLVESALVFLLGN